MIKKEIALYSFDELDEETKEKLIKEDMELQREFYIEDCLYEYLEEEATSLLNSHFENVKELKLLYDFSCSQGSGLLTEFTFTFKDELIKVKQNPNNHWYTYASNFILDFEDEESISDEEEQELRNKIIKVNKELEHIGYDFINDDDFYRECSTLYLEDEKLFFKDGTIYYDNMND